MLAAATPTLPLTVTGQTDEYAMPAGVNIHHLWQKDVAPQEWVHVLVQFRNNVSALRSVGCEVTSLAGDVAAVFVRAGYLEELRRHPEVVFIEDPWALKDETDVS